MPFPARALKKNIFFDVDIVVKNKSKFDISWSVLLVRVNTLPKQFFFELFLHIKRVCKSFSKESLTLTSSHLHNVARALSNLSRCFQLSRQRFISFFDTVVN